MEFLAIPSMTEGELQQDTGVNGGSEYSEIFEYSEYSEYSEHYEISHRFRNNQALPL